MKKELREKRKKLDEDYFSCLVEVIKYIRTLNLSKYAFYSLRDKAIEEIYEGQMNDVKPEKIFKHGLEPYFEKKANGLPRKTILESTLTFLFVFFALFSILLLFVYILRFFLKTDLFYSEGIYLHVSPVNLRNMSLYGFGGSIIASLVQRVEKKEKLIQIIGICIVAIVFIVTLTLLDQKTRIINLNVILFLGIFIAISIISYFANEYITKKAMK